MLGKLNHVAIAVPDLGEAAAKYKNILGAKVSEAIDLPEHGVTTIFVELDNTKIELLHPYGENSPITAFLQKNPNGGVHHLCFEVANIDTSISSLKNNQVRILGDGNPKIGAHGKPVIFLHPKDFSGTLIELEQEGD